MKLHNQKGVGLIEVLAALFILSVGLLGVAALQTIGIQSSYSASLRTSALHVIEDITSRMQANRQGVFAMTETPTTSYAIEEGDNGTSKDCSNVAIVATVKACSPSDMAQHDIFLWKKNIADLLPEGKGIIATDQINTGDTSVSVTITVSWQEKGQQNSQVSQFTVRGI